MGENEMTWYIPEKGVLFPDITSAPSPDRAPAPHVPPVSAQVPWRPRLS